MEHVISDGRFVRDLLRRSRFHSRVTRRRKYVRYDLYR